MMRDIGAAAKCRDDAARASAVAVHPILTLFGKVLFSMATDKPGPGRVLRRIHQFL
jgi:hypothetical protein